MFIRPCHRIKDGKRHAYWALVESVRTPRGPRQRVVAYLGQLQDDVRQCVRRAAVGTEANQPLLEDSPPPQWVTVDASRVHVERCLEFGAPWLGRELLGRLGLREFSHHVLPAG